jgi:FtsP/CotA-like multicopper oxidase with cupredoxin domain
VALGASTALLFGFLSIPALHMAVPGTAIADPIGQDPGSAPYYFSVPNYANSQLPVTALFNSVAGKGAAVRGNLVNGRLTGLTIMAGGTGYVAGETASIGPADTPGLATINGVDAVGAITSIAITNAGSGYSTVNGIRKFVDTLPGIDAAGANNLGQFIPKAIPDTTTFLGSDYYEIAIVEYEEKMHSDLLPTKLRGYVQLDTNVIPGAGVPLVNPNGTPINFPSGAQARGVTPAHYLGPLIAATKDRPVRIKFYNLLPTGVSGNLFVPVDTSVMGSGPGPSLTAADPDPQNPQCGAVGLKPLGCYAENRANLHLHGGLSPWISDGTPHQWVTPAGESTSYPKGVSTKNVPDMPDPGPGAITFFYTNQQSARLMFYHDHAWGMTRLNVYVGGAAPYMIKDEMEQQLTTDGILPGNVIPLAIQDKTFVPSDAQLISADPLWDKVRWGDAGDLWVPHVYVPAQNPGDSSGVNQFGRWAYGPWFWPPTNNIDYPPINNPYFVDSCNPDVNWCEPLLMPATPFVSMGMESFHDTPVVNGTAYPTVTVQPQAYWFRVLNAANDRSFNLSLYVADPAAATEVQLNPAEVAAALADSTVFPTPVAGTEGPSWIQIGSEGGFLPAPVVIPAQPTTWVNDPTVFNAGNVDQHSLLLAPAERADVIVDFSQYAGRTLILYNDAPAAFPARDPRYDYYTGNGDYRDTGGTPPTIAGYGPNTRTMMQIRVADGTGTPFNLAALQAAFAHKADGSGVFESSQNPIIVGQGAYNSAYGTSFQNNGPRAGLAQIYDTALSFDTLAGVPLVLPFQRKAIQDEMGEAFEKEYGRMSGNLGLEAPNTQAGLQQNLILYPFVNPATEVVKPIALPPGVNVTPISSATDGTQIWKITHNGVDTHPIHFHLFDVQVLNRVGWDGIIRKPDLNELGWKETVRISPLEDTIVALRPFQPKLPFGLPDSIRPLNPAMPIGSEAVFMNVDAFGNPISPPITNVMTNFEWEYVWHCHILSHEEMDMMRPISAQADPMLANPPRVTFTRNTTTGVVNLTWIDGTPINYNSPTTLTTWGSMANEIGYRIERALVANNGNIGAYTPIGTVLANQTAYIDSTALVNRNYRYRVVAYTAAGDTQSAPAGGSAVAAPVAPSNVVATLQAGPQVSLTWRDKANNEVFFLVELSVDGGPFNLIAQSPARNGTGNVTYVDTMVSSNHSYQYRVAAANANNAPYVFVNANLINAEAAPAAPSNLTGTVVRAGNRADVTLKWTDNSANETGFTIERATNSTFTVGSTLTNVAANTTTATQTRLYRGVTYFFRVRSNNLGGSSTWSNVFSVVTP